MASTFDEARAVIDAIVVAGAPGSLTAARLNTTLNDMVDASEAELTALVDAAPGALDTLNELAAALGDDANFAATMTTALAGKAASVHQHPATDISDSSALGRALVAATSAAAARASAILNIDAARANIGDANATIAATDRVVMTSAALTTARTWTLPAANAVNPGQTLYVVDLTGAVTPTNKITIARAGSDTIDGGTSIDLTTAYGGILFVSDGVSKWSAQALGSQSVAGVALLAGATFTGDIQSPNINATTALKKKGVAGEIVLARTSEIWTTGFTSSSTTAVEAWISGEIIKAAAQADASHVIISVSMHARSSRSANPTKSGFALAVRTFDGSTWSSWTTVSTKNLELSVGGATSTVIVGAIGWNGVEIDLTGKTKWQARITGVVITTGSTPDFTVQEVDLQGIEVL